MSSINKYAKERFPNYIYLFEKNYIKGNKDPISIFQRTRSEIYSRLNAKADQKELDDLAKWYQSGIDILAGAERSPDSLKIQNAIIDALTEKFGFDMDEVFNFDFSTMRVTKKDKNVMSGEVKRLKRIRRQGKLGNSETFHNRVTKSVKTLADIYEKEKNNTKRAELKGAIQKIGEVYKVFKDILSDTISVESAIALLKDAGIHVNDAAKKLFKTPIVTTGKRISYEAIDGFIKILNGIMIDYQSSILGSVQGLFAEYILQAIDKMADYTAEEVSDKYIKDSLIKLVNSSGGLLTSGTVEIIGKKETLTDLQKDTKGIVVNEDDVSAKLQIKYSSQQKADIIITLNNRTYPISIKNYASSTNPRFKKSVTLQSGSPLETLLFGIDNPNKNIGYHYLNILAEHDSEGDDPAFDSIKEEALATLALTMLYQAASGHGLGKDSGFAEILMWNDPKTGAVRFFDINSLISQLDPFKIKNSISKPKLNKLQIANKKETVKDGESLNSAIHRRLSKAMADMHAKKLTISIPQPELQSVLGSTIK